MSTNQPSDARFEAPPPPIVPQSRGAGLGCWKWAAVGCAGLVLVAAIGGFLAYRAARDFVDGMAEEYTDLAPVALPVVEASEEDAAAVLDRVSEFATALRYGTSPPPLVLSARDINLLINRHPEWHEVAGKVHVTVEGDTIQGQASIPLDELASMFEGRYLNGTVALRVEMTAGRLLVFLEEVEVGGRPLPSELMSALRAENLAKDANQRPEVQEVLGKLESITVRDGLVTIVPPVTVTGERHTLIHTHPSVGRLMPFVDRPSSRSSACPDSPAPTPRSAAVS